MRDDALSLNHIKDCLMDLQLYINMQCRGCPEKYFCADDCYCKTASKHLAHVKRALLDDEDDYDYC